MPPAFPDYEAFENYVDLMVEAGAMDDYTFCWWDVRPHPKIGTIELRIPDTQTSLRPAVALSALTQCLVARSLEDAAPHGPYDRELAIENKMRAARHGMDGRRLLRRRRKDHRTRPRPGPLPGRAAPSHLPGPLLRERATERPRDSRERDRQPTPAPHLRRERRFPGRGGFPHRRDTPGPRRGTELK